MILAYMLGNENWEQSEWIFLQHAVWMQSREHVVLVLGARQSRTEVFCVENGIKFIPILPHYEGFDFPESRRFRSILNKYEVEHLCLLQEGDISIGAISKYWNRVRRKKKFRLHFFYQKPLQNLFGGSLLKIRFSEYDSWIFPNKWMLDAPEIPSMISKKKRFYFQNAFDLNELSEIPGKEEVLKTLGLPSNQLTIGVKGGLGVLREQLLLLNALENLSTNVTVLFYTEGQTDDFDYIELLQDKITNLPSRISVYIRNEIKNDLLFYAALDVFFLAEINDYQGVDLCKARLHGVSSITKSSKTSEELIEMFDGIFLFSDEESLTFQLQSALAPLKLYPDKIMDFSKDTVLSNLEKHFESFSQENLSKPVKD